MSKLVIWLSLSKRIYKKKMRDSIKSQEDSIPSSPLMRAKVDNKSTAFLDKSTIFLEEANQKDMCVKKRNLE